MTKQPEPSYEELKRRLEAAESALLTIRQGQADTLMDEQGRSMVIRMTEAEAREAHFKQVLLAIRNVNQLIVSVEDAKELIEKACRNMTETLGYFNAWIALLGETEDTVTLTADAGFNDGFSLMRKRLLDGDFPDCVRKTLDKKDLVAIKDPVAECPDCPLSAQYAGRAGLIQRLEFQGRVYGVLSVSVPAAFAHDAEEQSLFIELAGNMSFALYKIKIMKEKKQQEDRIALLGHMLDEAPASITIHDTDGRFVFANRKTFALHGYSEEAFMSVNLHDLDVPESEALLAERFRRIAEKGEATFEVGHLRKDGTSFPLQVLAKQIEWEGRPAVLSIASDITAQKEAAAALLQSEKKYRLLADNTVDCIWMMNMDLNFVYINPAIEKMTGWAVDEWIGSNLRTHCDAANFELMTGVVMEALERLPDDSGILFDAMMLKKNGEPFAVEITGKVLLDASGTPSALQGVTRDITERKQAEAALRESEKKFREYVNNAPYAVFIANDAGRYLDVNPAASLLTGYAREELLNMAIPDLLAPEMLDTGMAHFAALKADGRAVADVMFHRKDGNTRWWTVNAVRLNDDRYLGFCQDITEQKKTEAEREKLSAQLNQAQKMESVGRLAGGVAHDFNNMLSVILGHGELALEAIDTDHPLREDLLEIMTAAKRSTNLTRQLLAFARRQTIAPRTIDLNETVEGMLRMLRRLIGEDVDLSWQPGPGRMPVFLDPSQLDQVLANLCVNARDAIAGVGKLTIATDNVNLDESYCAGRADVVPGDYMMLAVSDDGCGMDKETLDNIFEPFFTTKGVKEGTGLGLSTVFGIVSQNNGFITVYSEPGQGATFKIYLPRFAGPVETIDDHGPAGIPTGNGETVLVVEDEAAVLKLAGKMLSGLGYTVLTAAGPAAALELAKQHTGAIDLLMSDVVMPEANGRNLAEQLSALHPGLKVLFMSGYTADVIAHRGVLEEGVRFIQKPFNKRDLAIKVKETLLE